MVSVFRCVAAGANERDLRCVVADVLFQSGVRRVFKELEPHITQLVRQLAMFVRPSITAQMIRFIRGNYREFCRNQ
jgi:hypothetical protein